MTLESKKLLLIRQIMEINDEGVIDDLEQYVEEKAQHKSDNDILQQLARPIRPHFDLEAIKKEQGYQPINKEELNQLIKELDIQEPLEELVAYGLAEEDIQVAFRREEAPQVAGRLNMVEHLKGILPDVPYDKNDLYRQ